MILFQDEGATPMPQEGGDNAGGAEETSAPAEGGSDEGASDGGDAGAAM
jgi:hypothetical protein